MVEVEQDPDIRPSDGADHTVRLYLTRQDVSRDVSLIDRLDKKRDARGRSVCGYLAQVVDEHRLTGRQSGCRRKKSRENMDKSGARCRSVVGGHFEIMVEFAPGTRNACQSRLAARRVEENKVEMMLPQQPGNRCRGKITGVLDFDGIEPCSGSQGEPFPKWRLREHGGEIGGKARHATNSGCGGTGNLQRQSLVGKRNGVSPSLLDERTQEWEPRGTMGYQDVPERQGATRPAG